MSAAFGMLDLVVSILGAVFSSSILPVGLPPGDRDPALLRAPNEGCVFYCDWASMKAGQAGAPGIDGLVADPECRAFLHDVEQAIRTAVEKEIPDEETQKTLLVLPELVKLLIKQPGCFFISLGEDPIPERLDTPNFEIVLSRLKIGLVISAGQDAPMAEKAILRLMELTESDLPESLDRFVLPLPVPGGNVILHREGDYLILFFGSDQKDLDQIISGLKEERPALQERKRTEAAFKTLTAKRLARLCWVDIARLVEVADATAGADVQIKEVAQMLGLAGVQSYASLVEVDQEGRIVSRAFLKTDGSTDKFMSLAAGRALTPDDFEHIPLDADVVIVESINLVKIIAAVREILGDVDPPSAEAWEQMLNELDQELGVSLEKDFLVAFGQVWTLYNAPSHGGLLFSGPILTLEVKNPEKAREVFSNTMQLIKQELPGEFGTPYRRRAVTLNERTFLDRTIHYINTIGDDDFSIAPSFCLTDRHLVIALHPQPIKSHLRFLDAQGKSIAQQLRDRKELADREVIAWYQVDTARAAQLLYPLVPYIGQIAMSGIQSEGGEIDIFSIPSASAILPYFSQSNSWIERTPSGVSFRCVIGVPGLAW